MTFNHLTKKRDRNSVSRSRFGSTCHRTDSNAHEFRGFIGASAGTLAYDVKGNQTSRPSTLSAPALNLDWNFDNQLRGADTNGSAGSLEVTFEYDALGRRVSRSHSSGNVVYVHAGQQEIADYARGAVTSSPTYRYVYADYVDEPIVRHTGTATTLPTTGDNALYYHRNQQYSIIGLTNATGTLVERYSYTAYGTLSIYAAKGTVRTSSTYANRYTYTGREYDADLNLYHFRARWYDPATGGFISRDPLGYVDGMNLYRGYFGVRGVDPFGLDYHHWFCRLGGRGQALIDSKCPDVKIDIDRYTTEYDGGQSGTPHSFLHNKLKYHQVYEFFIGSAPDCCSALLMTWALMEVYHDMFKNAKLLGYFPNSTQDLNFEPFFNLTVYQKDSPKTGQELFKKVLDACSCDVDTPIGATVGRKEKYKEVLRDWIPKDAPQLWDPRLPALAAVTIAVMDVIIIATLTEDVLTGGVGVLDDPITLAPAVGVRCATRHAVVTTAKEACRKSLRERLPGYFLAP